MHIGYLRGHKIYYDKDLKWKYCDTNEEISKRPISNDHLTCPHCKNKFENDYDPDPCLGHLPGVKNACCGHGNQDQSYIVFNNGLIIRNFIVQ